MNIFFDTIKTNVGWVGIQYSDNGIKKITLPNKSIFDCKNEIEIYHKPNFINEKKIESLSTDITEYFEGKNIDFSTYSIDLSNFSDFARLTLNACRKIPYGKTKSYQWIAKRINFPLSSRAVGQILARNPCPIIIPCHRVISKQGQLTGYGGKQNRIELKKNMLDLESDL